MKQIQIWAVIDLTSGNITITLNFHKILYWKENTLSVMTTAKALGQFKDA